MTRYAAFAFAKYYPNGGWGDVIGLYLESERIPADLREWYLREQRGGHAYWQIVDMQTREIIDRGEFDDRGNPVIGEAP